MSKTNGASHNVDHFETVDGRSWQVLPVSFEWVERAVRAIETRYRKEGRQVDPPTYEVENVGGDKLSYPHTEETIKNHPEHEEAWIAYRQTMQALIDEGNNVRSRILLTEGLVIKEIPEAWYKRNEKYGVPVPEDPDDQKYDYIVTDVLKTPEDIVRALGVIQQYSVTGHLTEEDIAAAIDTFRNYMVAQERQAERDQFEGTSEVGALTEALIDTYDQGMGQASE